MQSKSETLSHLLLRSSAWNETLSTRLEALKRNRNAMDLANQAFELGEAIEHCNPDRSSAIAAYVLCYSSDHRRIDALVKARRLSLELGDFATAARLAQFQYKQERKPDLLVKEGMSWLDAGQPDRALKPLTSAQTHFPESWLVRSALQTARQEWPDVRAEIGRLKKAAQQAQSGEEVAHILMQAVRTMHMLSANEGVMDRYLLTAFKANPENRSALGMLEHRLPHLEYPDAFLAICEERIANRESQTDLVEELRRLATRLFACVRYRSMGVRVLKRALQEAYSGGLEHIPGHLAMHVLLLEHCEESSLLKEYLVLVETGLSLPLPKLDLLFLALQGLSLTWRTFGDSVGASQFAAVAQELSPAHPLVLEAESAGIIARQGEPIFLDELPQNVPTDGNAELHGAQADFIELPLEELAIEVQPVEAVLELDLADAAEGRADTIAEDLDFSVDEFEYEEESADDAETEHLDVEVEEIVLAEDAIEEIVLAEDTAEEISLSVAVEPAAMATLSRDEDEVGERLPDEDALPDVLDLIAKIDAAWGDDDDDWAGATEPVVTAAKAEVSIPAPPKITLPIVRPAIERHGSEPKEESIRPTPSAPKALGKISLIPSAAIHALKRSAVERNKVPSNVPSRATRLLTPLAIEFVLDGRNCRALTRDLSITGAFIVTSLIIPREKPLRIKILLPQGKDSLQTTSYDLEAKISRAISTGYGITFIAPSKVFVDHLRILIKESC